jgi:hypothetical protein
MPKPKNYGWDTHEEMMENRRKKDNIQKKISYWRKTYGFDINKEDYDEFIKMIPVVKKIYMHLEKYLQYDKDKQITDDDFHFYANNYDKLKLVQDNREYLSKLKRISNHNLNKITLVF